MRLNPLAASRCHDIAPLQPLALGYNQVYGERAIHWNNRKRSGADGQPHHLLQYTTAGRGWFADQQRDEPLPAGWAFLIEIPSPTVYRLPLGEHWEWVWFIFRGTEATRLVRRIQASLGARIPLHGHPAARQLCRMYDDACLGRRQDPLQQSVQLYRLLLSVLDLARQREPASPMPDPVRSALAHLHQHASDPDLDLPRLAQAAGVSRFHLARLFRQHLGCSPSERLRRERLERARHLLTYTDSSITEIASSCGFGSTVHFCATFRKHFARSPGSLRGG